MAHNQGRFIEIPQKVLKQNLRSQIQKVGGLVKHQHRLGSLSSRAASLTRVCHPPESDLTGPSKVGTLQLKLTSNLSATPIRLSIAIPD